jgi:hypothetical protein
MKKERKKKEKKGGGRMVDITKIISVNNEIDQVVTTKLSQVP